MKKYLLLSLFIILLNSVSAAHFIAGHVNDADDGTSAVGRFVQIYAQSDPSLTESCMIEEDHYYSQCDLEQVKNKAYKPGDKIMVEVVDSGDGYTAGPVEVTVSGQGYTLAPDMKLGKQQIKPQPEPKPVPVTGQVVRTQPETSENQLSKFVGLSLIMNVVQLIVIVFFILKKKEER